MKPILEVHNVSKKFQIDHDRSAYLSLRDRIAGAFKPKSKKEDFWALKDVSFNVMPGESIGIIGRNGAGKSTLLKILSRITPPTDGNIIVRGRIASLLEVGTGFHQELTGRENIFMNGSILGMKNAEIKSRFDEIVDFSGVERFLDTPLKNYSSGMQLRLAFAVAAHLEPEILIIDEVLAVGDGEFQKKCIGKMEEVSGHGRTIIFVSHSMPTIERLCRATILLENGTLKERGDTDKVISRYLVPKMEEAERNITKFIKYYVDFFTIRHVSINNNDTSAPIFLKDNSLFIEVNFTLIKESVMELEFHLKKGEDFVASYANFLKNEPLKFGHGEHKISFELQLPELLQGLYYLDIDFTHPLVEGLASIRNVIFIEKINAQIKTNINNELRNWSKVILSGKANINLD